MGTLKDKVSVPLVSVMGIKEDIANLPDGSWKLTPVEQFQKWDENTIAVNPLDLKSLVDSHTRLMKACNVALQRSMTADEYKQVAEKL
jgi:hypothetical protein